MSSALRISIGVNLALAGVVVALLTRQAPDAPGRQPSRMRVDVARSEAAPSMQSAPEVPPSVSAKPRLTPSGLAQLEQLGIPRDLVVGAFLQDFHRRWDDRFAALQKQHAPKPVPEREYVELARRREAEQIRELKEALGEAGYLAWDKERALQAVNSAGAPMTPAEAEQAYRLQKEFEQQHQELQRAMEDGVADQADVAALQAQAQTALEQELEKLFGQERLNQMRGITNPVADVQWRYGGLNPTRFQAEAVVAAEAAHRAGEAALAQRLRSNPADATALAAELQALNDARDDEMRRIFGPAAYDAAARQGDATYQTLRQFAGAWNLAQGEVDAVYENLRTLRDQTERTRSAAAMREAAGQRVDWPAIQASIQEAQQQATQRLQTLIGSERVRRLERNGLLATR